MIYNFMAASPCSIFMLGERKSFKAGDVFSVEDEATANQLQDAKHPQYTHLRLLSVEGAEDVAPPEPSRGEQILNLISIQTPPDDFISTDVKTQDELDLIKAEETSSSLTLPSEEKEGAEGVTPEVPVKEVEAESLGLEPDMTLEETVETSHVQTLEEPELGGTEVTTTPKKRRKAVEE